MIIVFGFAAMTLAMWMFWNYVMLNVLELENHNLHGHYLWFYSNDLRNVETMEVCGTQLQVCSTLCQPNESTESSTEMQTRFRR